VAGDQQQAERRGRDDRSRARHLAGACDELRSGSAIELRTVPN
jgi:hypothetical protein